MSGGGDLVNNFRDFVQREDLLQADDQLLLAASAGIDSTVLAWLLKEEGYHFSIVHCNFQLRGKESTADEEFVRHLAYRLDVRLFTQRFSLPKDRLAGESTQMVARRLRYNYFKKILDEYKLKAVVTAHHLDDSFETMLMNLVRGTGLAGLRGIDPRTDFVVIRPLLEATKDEIRGYASSRSIKWRDDHSNDSDDYTRNRIRHHLLPQFLQSFGMSTEGLASTLSNLRSAHRFYEQGLSLRHNPCLVRSSHGFRFNRRTCPLGLVDTITLLRHHTGYMGFRREDYRQMLSVAGYRSIRSDSYVARVSTERIEFLPQTSLSTATYHVDGLPFELILPDRTLEIDLVRRPVRLDCPLTLYCRFPGFPLHLRPRQPGDRFQPLGMQGTKKVEKFFGDEKIAPWDRERSRLLTTGAGQVMAVIPYRIDDRYALRGGEERVLRIHCRMKNPDPR